MQRIKITLAALLTLISIVLPQNSEVFIGTIEGDIDLGLAPYVRRVVAEAEDANANAIIFKINTFGGRVDAASKMP